MSVNSHFKSSVRSAQGLLRSICIVVVALLFGSLQVWGADVDVSFASWAVSIQTYNATKWTDNGCTFTYASNNQKNWAYVRCGGKGEGMTSTIQYNSKVTIPVESVVLNKTSIGNGSSSSITITGVSVSAYSDKEFTSLVSTKDLGTISYTSSNCPSSFTLTPSTPWAKDLYYKITISWNQTGKKNCGLNISSITFKEASGPTLYTVTFDANGGSVTPTSDTQASAGAAITLPIPTRDGYNCTGWYTATSGGTKRGDAGGSYTPTASETIYAQWSAKTYTNYRTSCSAPSCDEPTSLTKGTVTSTTVGLTITDPANTGTYEIYYNTTGTAPSSGTGASATYNITNPTVTGLLSGVTYYMWVRSKCDESTKSNWVALTGSTVTTTCGDPSNLSASSVIHATTGQNGGVTLSWDGDPSNYDIYYKQDDTAPDAGQNPSQSVDGAKTYDVTGLTAGTYYWWVRSNCSSGKGSWVGGSPFTIKGIKVGGTTPVDFGTVNQNDIVDAKFITVTGVGLESGTNITATMSSGSPFSLDPTSVDYDASGTHVNISASTATAGTYNQTLTLSYGGTYTATVTVMMTVQAVYTVTYVHHDKGTFSGVSTTQYVPTNNNTITLPTVTGVSCGFYDTFEGWIASGSEYSESTSKPATVYAGGSSYTVTGDVTLRALYSKCEGDGGSVYRKVTAIGDVTDGTYILVSNNSTPHVYSGHTGSNNYGNIVSGLTNDGDDYSSTLPLGAVPVTIAKGTETHISHFTIKNGTKYFKAGTDIALQDTESWWQLTDGSKVSSKACPAGALQPVNSQTYVMQEYGSNRFKTYANTQSYYVFLYKLIDKCTKYYATDPSCVKPTGVHIVYNANAGDATMSCNNHNRTYKVQDEVNQYPKLASAYSFCTDATRDGYTLVGWNTQANGLGTTYDIDHSYSSLPVSGELDGENWVTLNLYAMWAPAVSFNLGNAAGGTGVPAVVEADGGFMLPAPTDEQLGVIPCGYSFYGWSESSVVATNTKPALFMPGTKYTGGARTLYAVYRLAGEGGGDQYYFTFEVDSKTYCITRKHANYDRFVVEETTTGLEFGLDNGYLYYMDNDARVYVYWAGGSTTVTTTSIMPNNNAYKTTFVPGANGTTIVTPATSGRYLQMPESNTDRAYYTTTEVNPTLVEATSYTYATNPSCETTATLAFVTNGGTLNYPNTYDASNYVDLTVGTTVYLPTATYAGEWVFEGWMKGAPVTDTDMRPESANFIEVTLNTTTYSAAPAGTTTFYAVYSKTVNDNQFDPVNGGTYKLFAIMADGTTKKYMPEWDGTQTTLSPVTSCASTGDYTITPGTDEHAGQYKITHGVYTLGVKGEGDTQFKNDANAWWDIEPSTSGKGTWRITIHGSSTRCMALSGTGFFSNTIISNFVDNPSQPGYRDMEIGECIYTEYTSTPENIPYITITGSPVKITSTNGERVYAPTKLHIEAHNFSTTRTIHFSATNGFATNPASVNTGANGAYSGDIDIYYQPTSDGDGSIVSSVLTASQKAGPAAEQVSQTFSAIRGRNMPAKFVIAAKIGGQWYAMPDDKSTTETMTALPIEVNDADAPTSATLVPHNVEWSLSDVVNSNDRPKDKVYLYESNKMKDDGITPWNYALYAGTAPTIGTYGQVSGISGTSSDRYEWGLTTSNLLEYTISNATVGKNISISNAGNFGTHASAIASSTLFLLPIENYYELAEMQAVEWKANSVVVMFRGAGSKATAKLGAGAEGSAQSLTSVKKDHGVYEIATADLTSAAGQSLAITIKNSSDVVLGRKLLVVPAIVSVNKNSDALGVTTDAAAATDVVVLDGATLSAVATKYTFKNITVYPGGKLVIGSGKQLGMASLTLRGGSAWGAATYEHKYPQFVVNNTTSGAYSNTSSVINYDYVTTKDQYYSFVLPYAGNTGTIKYPLDIYGRALESGSQASFEFQYYDGAARAAGDTGWKVLAEPATLVAGTGYTFLGMPRKVDAYDGTDDSHANVRQRYGIHRIPMSVAAAAVQAGETNSDPGKATPIRVTLASKNNNSGWNLVGNPYLSNVSGLSNTDIQVGKLVHTDTNPWDGKWQWDNPTTGVRYIVLTDDGQTFESQQAITATLKAFKNFFVQIQNGGATSLVIPANTRTDRNLAPARYMADVEQDIQLAVDLVSETRSDKVDLLINDIYTAEFDQDGDFTKMMNTTKFNLYGVYPGDNLSFIAVDKTTAAGSIAIGYQVPAAGEYTLQLSERPYVMSDYVETLLVTDHEVSPEVTTDLLENPYSFTVTKAETNDARFTVSIKLKENQDTPTDIDIINGGGDLDGEKPIKFIYHDKMYILRNGVLYDATGKKVREIK